MDHGLHAHPEEGNTLSPQKVVPYWCWSLISHTWFVNSRYSIDYLGEAKVSLPQTENNILNLWDQLKSTARTGLFFKLRPSLYTQMWDGKAVGQKAANRCFSGPNSAPAAPVSAFIFCLPCIDIFADRPVHAILLALARETEYVSVGAVGVCKFSPSPGSEVGRGCWEQILLVSRDGHRHTT